jgi:hypothetical protein
MAERNYAGWEKGKTLGEGGRAKSFWPVALTEYLTCSAASTPCVPPASPTHGHHLQRRARPTLVPILIQNWEP